MNTYGYVGGNSLSLIDPLGLDGISLNFANSGTDTYDKIGFTLEEVFKMSFSNRASQEGTLYILSHGSVNTMNGILGSNMAQQLISGTVGNNIKTDYVARRLRNSQNINIVLDACNVGSPNWTNGKLEDNFTTTLGKGLRSYLDRKGLHNIKINIIAPSGYAHWNGISSNPINDIITPMYIMGKGIESAGKWENFKF